jgi:hypothetical protein
MSTRYLAPREGLVSVSIEEAGRRVVLIYEDGCVTLSGAPERVWEVARWAGWDRDERVADGPSGRVLQPAAAYLPDAAPVMSEYGDLTTMGDLRRAARR